MLEIVDCQFLATDAGRSEVDERAGSKFGLVIAGSKLALPGIETREGLSRTTTMAAARILGEAAAGNRIQLTNCVATPPVAEQ